jgi:hypothetical protein
MNDTELHHRAARATNRKGLQRLLELLGFAGPYTPAPRYAMPVRARMSEFARGTLLVTIVELRSGTDAYTCRHIAHTLTAARPAAHHLIAILAPHTNRIDFVIAGGAASFHRASLDTAQLRTCDIDLLREMIVPASESGTAAALRLERALDRRRVSERFFRDVSACRTRLATAWKGLPANATQDREALALLLLSRLMFLYFLQQQGLLAGDTMFVAKLLRARPHTTRTLYRSLLRTLFFGVLNRRPERRSAGARALGELPYLNGGLFEEHALERRRPDLDLPDDALLGAVTDVLEKYRFTTRDGDADGSHAAIEPEMLGRIFEGLMPGERRQRTGSFYTPSELVDRVTRRTLTMHVAEHCAVPEAVVRTALLAPHDVPADTRMLIAERCGQLTVLDPACGSGSFLLGALDTIVALRRACGDVAPPIEETRRAIVARSLHGVDVLGDAALICSLRLWLALVPRCERVDDVPPLPNLDRHMRQGDALIEPFDLAARAHSPELPFDHRLRLQRITARLTPLAQRYMSAGPDTKGQIRRDLQRYEMQLARSWTDALHTQLQRQARELRARSGDRDLFGSPAAHAVSAASMLELNTRQQAQLDALLDDLQHSSNLPFFSFRVHFPHVAHGFDTILMNPPWVRSHRWPAAARDILRERYSVCSHAGWAYAARATGATAGASAQVDLSLLFLERAVRLLAERGTLGAILPAKLFRSLYAGGARALLLEHTQLCVIEDYSLDHRDVFNADAFPAVVIAHRSCERRERDAIDVRLARRNLEPLCFSVRTTELSLRPGDTQSPWILAPPECVAALRTMQRNGIALMELGLAIRRGVMSAANEVLVLSSVEPKLGGLLQIRSEGHDRALQGDRRRHRGVIEESCVRPCLRGTDVRAWQCNIRRHVIWSPHNDDRTAQLPRGLQRYLRQNAELLRGRRALDGMLRRLSPQLMQHKVVWADVATLLRACAVPASARTCWGRETPTIPLNTVYFIGTDTLERAQLLAAYMNSLPSRVFTRTIAERAKDAHFRFFAWTVGMLPLPRDWDTGANASALLEISRRAHAQQGIDRATQLELDALVAAAYGLDDCAITALRTFDQWLEGS